MSQSFTPPPPPPQTHLPGYINDYDKLKASGVEVVACVAVNDVFVMAAWGESQNAAGKVRMLADPCGDFTKVRDAVVHIMINRPANSLTYLPLSCDLTSDFF